MVLTVGFRPRVSSGFFDALRWLSETTVETPRRTAETVALMSIADSFWDQRVSADLDSNDRTHVKDLKNLVEVQLPGGDRPIVAPRVKPPRDHIPFTSLDQFPLNFLSSPSGFFP